MIAWMDEMLAWERRLRHAFSLIYLARLLGQPPVILTERTVHNRQKPTPAGRSPPLPRRLRGAGFEARSAPGSRTSDVTRRASRGNREALHVL